MVLPELYLSIHATFMQIYAYLLRIRAGGNKKIRTVQGHLACPKATLKMPPGRRFRIRPCAMKILDVHTHRGETANEQSVISLTPYEYLESKPVGPFSIGIHPWDTVSDPEAQFSVLKEILSHTEPIAVGECGLDALRGADMDTQLDFLTRQTDLAAEAGLPAILHIVKKFDEIIKLRRRYGASQQFLVHGFRGNPQQAMQLIRNNIRISFGIHFNPMTIQAIPLQDLLFETDGKCTVNEVIDAASATLGIPENSLRTIAFENAGIFFKQ